MKRKLKTISNIAGIIIFIFLLLLFQLFNEEWYAKHVHPREMKTIEEFYIKFSSSNGGRIIKIDGTPFLVVRGVDQPWWCTALPSSRPEYLFDNEGKFIDWCLDPGDCPKCQKKWPLKNSIILKDKEIREFYNLVKVKK